MQSPASENPSLRVSVAAQTLDLCASGGEILRSYPVSTSRFGLGSEPGSFRTPLGGFRIAEKIGEGEPLGMLFKSRQSTGEDGQHLTAADLVLTRILWLDGLDEENANTLERYIYIHGTNHEELVGQPVSHGCIRMLNADVAELFELVQVGTEVWIKED